MANFTLISTMNRPPIYDNGIEYNDMSVSLSGGTVLFASDSIQLGYSSFLNDISVTTHEKINLSNYNTLGVDFVYYSGGSWVNRTIGFSMGSINSSHYVRVQRLYDGSRNPHYFSLSVGDNYSDNFSTYVVRVVIGPLLLLEPTITINRIHMSNNPI